MALRPKRHPDMNLNDVDYSITYQLCHNFDVDRTWEQLASVIGYSTKDILTFELETRRPDGSPTKKLLWDWGSRGGTVRDLYDKLALINKAQSMRLLEHIMNKDKEEKKEAQGSKNPRSSGSSLENNCLQSLSGEPSTMSYNPSSLPVPVINKRHKLASEVNEDINLNKHNEDKNTDKQINKVLILEPGAASVEMMQCQADGPSSAKGHIGAASSSSSSSVTKFNRARSVVEDYGHNADLATLSLDERIMARAMMNTPHYTYKELSQATGGFSASSKLGQGKFGAVYLGIVKNTKCAIKKLIQKNDKQSEESSTAHLASELKALCRYRHENIVTLYGYALDGDEVCLVYQYMPNRSVDDCLHTKGAKSLVLTWQQRLSILQGAACGLQFLHTVDTKPVIHGDIKSANILLDRHFEAKIGDLGLAQQATGGEVTGRLTHISKVKTCIQDYRNQAYLAPEIMRGNAFSIKGDTYAFGVVIFECLTGQEAFDERREGSTEEKYLLAYLSNQVSENPKLNKQKMFQDPRMKEAFPETMFEQMFDLGETCTKAKKKDRPTMVEAYQELEKIEKVYNGPDYHNIQENNLAKLPRKGSSDVNKPYSIAEATGVSFDSNGSYSPGLKSGNQPQCQNAIPPTSKPAPSKVATVGSPIDCLPKNQPIPEAFRLQLEMDKKKENLQTPEYENISCKLKQIYASDPKKLSEIEKSDREFNSPPNAVEVVSEYPSDNKKAKAIEDFDRKNMGEVKTSGQVPVEVDYASDPKKLAMLEGQTNVLKNAMAVESHDYENLPKETIVGHCNVEQLKTKGAAPECDLDQEFAEIACKAKKGNSFGMMDIFNKYEDLKLDDQYEYGDDNGDQDGFDDFGNYDFEKQDSETSTIKDDFENFHVSDINDDDLFGRESEVLADNRQNMVQPHTVEESLEDHQRRLAKYTEISSKNLDEAQVERGPGVPQGGNLDPTVSHGPAEHYLKRPKAREPAEGEDNECKPVFC